VNASWLFERLAEYGDAPALVHRERSYTYTEVLRQIAEWQGRLPAVGIEKGSVVVVDGSFTPGAVGLVLALIRVGAVVVPTTPLTRTLRDKYEEISEAGFTVEFDDRDEATVTRHDRVVTHALTKKLIARDHPGLVIFSSGSTGEPKAVLHDFVALLEKFKRAGIRKTTLSFLLFDHIGGMDSLFNSLSNGGTLVTSEGRDPEAVCKTIAAHQVHTLPASPTFLNLILISEAYKRYDLSCLKVIAYGTEPMPASLLARLTQAFPEAKFVQTYGISELGVMRTRSRENGSLWMKFSGEGFETKIVDGILWIRTPTAMLGYLNAPDLFDEEGWLNTQDAVEVDGEYVHILGRATDLVNVGGQKVYPAEVENVIMTMDNVRDVAVFGEPNPLLGQTLVARVNLINEEPLEAFKTRLRTFCRERLPRYQVPVRIEITEEDQFGQRLKKMRKKVPPSGSKAET
jgi:acyl-CoA synthetase (AMP-forming)/AMP-acid ligase II